MAYLLLYLGWTVSSLVFIYLMYVNDLVRRPYMIHPVTLWTSISNSILFDWYVTYTLKSVMKLDLSESILVFILPPQNGLCTSTYIISIYWHVLYLYSYLLCCVTKYLFIVLVSEMTSNASVRDFYKGRSILVTGGTGFMGKVLIEKLLYTVPEIANIYILMRPKRGKSVLQRLEDMHRLPVSIY